MERRRGSSDPRRSNPENYIPLGMIDLRYILSDGSIPDLVDDYLHGPPQQRRRIDDSPQASLGEVSPPRETDRRVPRLELEFTSNEGTESD